MPRPALAILLGVSLAHCSRTAGPRESAVAEPAGPTAPSAGVALVELFTSEGCSSCPPADEVVNALPARAGDREVVVVAWHVDYWDSLGWPDPYASSAASARQRGLARALGQSGVYTPEVVLDGAEYTGNRRELTNALAAPPALPSLALTVAARADGGASVTYSAPGAPPGARVVIVLTEDGLSQPVPRGENAGSTLRHDHVARAMVTASGPDGVVALTVPAGVVRARASVVAFVEDPSTMRKLAASRVPLGG